MKKPAIEKLLAFDLDRAMVPWELRRQEGKELRRTVPRESHAAWKPGKTRPDPVETVQANNKGRQAQLVPLRMGRMAASPFAFLRGSACVMARDLAETPITGFSVVIDGDAHLNNFGMYGTPQREVVFDLNDFDEAVYRSLGVGFEAPGCQRKCGRAAKRVKRARASGGGRALRKRLPVQCQPPATDGCLGRVVSPRLS